MRKLLLATVAGLGSWGAIASGANAQAPTQTPTQSNASYTSYQGGVALPSASTPTPGTVVVRLNGRVRFYAYGAFDRDANNNAAGTATGTVNAAGQGTASGTNKLQTYGFAEYGRLYPGFDGVAANGLKYGANMEIRQDQNHGAGGGTFGSVSGENSARGTLYFRRVWGYLGTDAVGTVRLGSTDQPTSLYMTGNFENFNDAGWNGDLPGFLAQNIIPAWPFSDLGSYYTTNKIVYLSPSIYGFDLGASYEPSTANTNGNSGCGSGTYVGSNFVNANGAFTAAAGANGQSVAGPGCDRLASTPVNGETSRRKNTFDTLIRYRGTFGPVGIAATAAYITGSHVQDDQTGVAYNNNSLAGTVRYKYDGPSIGDFGAALTIAGASVGGHYTYGRYNGQVGNLVPAGLKSGDAWIAGASYTFGPTIIGAQWFVNETAGDLQNAVQGRNRREQGIAAGGTYSLAPGISIFLSALWGERKQAGYNFITGQGVTAATPGGNPFSNNVTVSAVSLGTAFSW
jgi:predicted porin